MLTVRFGKERHMVKALSKIAFALTLIIISFGLIVEMKYTISANEYLAYSQPLTREEQQYLDEIEILKYGVDPENAPFSEVNSDGEASGLIIDYIAILSEKLDIPIVETAVRTSEQPQALKDNEINIADLFDDTEANGRYAPTQPIYKLEGIIVTAYENKQVNYYEDFAKTPLAVVKDPFVEGKIEESFPKGQNTKIIYVDSPKEGLELVMSGEAGGFAGNELSISHYADELGIEDKLRQVGDDLYKEDVSLAVSVYDTKLYNILNKTLLKLKKEGAFVNAQKEWLGSSADMVTNSVSVRWAEYIIIFCVGLVVILMLWESVLNRRIDKKTRELQIERNNLQTVIDNIDALIAVISEEDIIVQCNAYGKRMLEDEKGSFIGCGVGTIELLSRLKQMYDASPEQPYYSYEGHDYHIHLRTLNPKKGNRLLQIDDCTESNQTERRLRQENKMIAVGQLSAGLAHEIRNPLGLIKNYSYILRDYEAEHEADEMFEHSLDVIGDSVSRIDNLIENLLSFSRLSNDEKAVFNLEKLLQSIISLERKKLDTQNIRLTLDCTKDLDICTREETVKIAAFNLVNNAVEALGDMGKATGEIHISVNEEYEGGKRIVRLEIEDNGPGISEEAQEKIFNPFFTTKDKGTGLGLYIVNSEIEKVGGRISVASEEGKGTKFTLRIPDGRAEKM